MRVVEYEHPYLYISPSYDKVTVLLLVTPAVFLPGPAIEGNADRAECPDCSCRPCVMDESHRQHIYLFLIESPQIDITIKQHTKLVYALKSVAQRF